MTEETQAPLNETKADRFKRVAQPRFAKAIKSIQVLKNCASDDYEYTEEQINIINDTLLKEIAALYKAFKHKDKPPLDAPEL